MYEPAVNSDQLTGLCAAALEALPRPIVVCDQETVLFANDAAARMFRAGSASELVGLPVNEILHPDMHDAAATRRELLAESRQDLHGIPAKLIGRDGSSFCSVAAARSIVFGGDAAIAFTYGPIRTLADRS